jgi:Rieske Fe-S protein
MEESTRRGFLIMAGVGAAAATAGAVVATSTTATTTATTTAAAAPAEADTPAAGALVAYVEDVRTGRVSVMAGETEVVVSDPDLVARLARVAARKKA